MGALEQTSIEEIKAQFETFWRSKSNAGSNTHNEKADRRHNSEHNLFRWKNIFSTKLTVQWNQICFRRSV